MAPCLKSSALWGVFSNGELNAVTGAKATTRSPFFSPLRTWDCQRRAAPVGRNYPDRMPQMIRFRLRVKGAHEAVLAWLACRGCARRLPKPHWHGERTPHRYFEIPGAKSAGVFRGSAN